MKLFQILLQHYYVKNFLIKFLIKNMKVFVLSLLVAVSLCAKGFDVSELFSLDTYQCFVRNGAQFAIVQGMTNYGQVDSNALQNLKSIKNLGLKTDIFMRNCRGRDPVQQVNALIDAIPGYYYDTVWVYAQKNTLPSCDWSSYADSSNCQYLNSIARAIQNRGKQVGFYSSVTDWAYIFKNVNGCPALGDYPIWYQYADDIQSFANFRSFGGWNQPSMKKFSTNYSWCGTESTNLNYKP